MPSQLVDLEPCITLLMFELISVEEQGYFITKTTDCNPGYTKTLDNNILKHVNLRTLS